MSEAKRLGKLMIGIIKSAANIKFLHGAYKISDILKVYQGKRSFNPSKKLRKLIKDEKNAKSFFLNLLSVQKRQNPDIIFIPETLFSDREEIVRYIETISKIRKYRE